MHDSVKPELALTAPKGETLADRMAASHDRPLPVRDVVRVGRAIASILAVAHEQGLIHRQVEPANIWLETKADRAKLLNFCPAHPADQDRRAAQAGITLGAASYISPEQVCGEAVDHRTDLFSLGSVLYHIATGRRPFRGSNLVGTLLAIATIEPAAPVTVNTGLPEALSRLIRDLMAKRPDDRPSGANQVVERLLAIERTIPLAQPSLVGAAAYGSTQAKQLLPAHRRVLSDRR